MEDGDVSFGYVVLTRPFPDFEHVCFYFMGLPPQLSRTVATTPTFRASGRFIFQPLLFLICSKFNSHFSLLCVNSFSSFPFFFLFFLPPRFTSVKTLQADAVAAAEATAEALREAAAATASALAAAADKAQLAQEAVDLAFANAEDATADALQRAAVAADNRQKATDKAIKETKDSITTVVAPQINSVKNDIKALQAKIQKDIDEVSQSTFHTTFLCPHSATQNCVPIFECLHRVY